MGSRGPYSNSRIYLTWRIIIMGPNNTKTLLQLILFPPPGPTTLPHLTLIMKTFQMIFLYLVPCKITLSSACHVVLIAYNAEHGMVDWRHYCITVTRHSVAHPPAQWHGWCWWWRQRGNRFGEQEGRRRLQTCVIQHGCECERRWQWQWQWWWWVQGCHV